MLRFRRASEPSECRALGWIRWCADAECGDGERLFSYHLVVKRRICVLLQLGNGLFAQLNRD
jgi:hypothetical protein